MSVKETTAFLDALRAGTKCNCRRCGSGSDSECRKRLLADLHPADVWTIHELRAPSIDGSFR